MPNTPLAKPRRAGGNQALENGTPAAKIVPATPSRNPATSSSGKLRMLPASATSSTAGTETSSTAANMRRPPKRSVMAPTTMRPSAPTSTGVASMSEIWPWSSPISAA
jgi:antitoxin (DNA-binding transcriptional repressor) of toxin-antitoxin stability system